MIRFVEYTDYGIASKEDI